MIACQQVLDAVWTAASSTISECLVPCAAFEGISGMNEVVSGQIAEMGEKLFETKRAHFWIFGFRAPHFLRPFQVPPALAAIELSGLESGRGCWHPVSLRW